MSHPMPTHADRVARSLKRLEFRMTRTGRSFSRHRCHRRARRQQQAGHVAGGDRKVDCISRPRAWVGLILLGRAVGEFIKLKPRS
jgi:hypothetical protein